MQSEFEQACQILSLGKDEKRMAQQLQNSDFKNFFISLTVLGANEETQEALEKISCCVSLFRMKQLILRLEKTEYLQDYLRGFLQKKVRQAIKRKQKIFQQQDSRLFLEQMQNHYQLNDINSEILRILDRQHGQEYFMFRVTVEDVLKQKKSLEIENPIWRMKPVFAQICQIMDLNEFQRKMVSQLQGRYYKRCFDELTRVGVKEGSSQTIQRICCCISHFRAIEIRLATKRSSNLTASEKQIFFDSLSKAIQRKQKMQRSRLSHVQLYLSQLRNLPQFMEKNRKLFDERNETNFQGCCLFRITIQDVKQQKEKLEETIPMIEKMRRFFTGLIRQDKEKDIKEPLHNFFVQSKQNV